MADLHTRTATFASLKCRSKCDIFAPKGRVKNKGKRAVFPYGKASSASLTYPFLPRLCCHNKYRLTKADSTNRVSFLPNQTAATFSSHKKTASKFSLLLLPSFCVSLHFDLLFCKLDFFQSQLHEQSQNTNTVCYPTS